MRVLAPPLTLLYMLQNRKVKNFLIYISRVFHIDYGLIFPIIYIYKYNKFIEKVITFVLFFDTFIFFQNQNIFTCFLSSMESLKAHYVSRIYK